MEHKQKKVIALPGTLQKEIESLSISRIQKNNLICFIQLLYNKSKKKHSDFTSPVPLSYTYLLENFPSNYNKNFLQLAVDSKIIVRNESYTVATDKKEGKPKTYNINPDFFQTENFEFKTVTYTAKVFKTETKEQTEIEKLISDDLGSLEYNFNLYRTMTKNYADSISLTDDNFTVNDEIEFDTDRAFFVNKIKGKKENLSTKYVVANAKAKNLVVIKTKSGYIIDDPNKFILERKNTIYMSYMFALDNLENGFFYGARNTTNNRLDNNFTNMSKRLTFQIKKDNGLDEIDLGNSQFAILGWLLPKEIKGHRVDLFKDIVASGQLYNRMKVLLNLKNRDEAKQLMFQINFGNNPTKPTANYKKICAEFPEVMKWIWDYKEQNGYKAFSVMLQNEESKMFIDDMYFHIKKKMKLFCIPKHDSFIVRIEDKAKIEQYMGEYFKKIGFNCSLNYTPVQTAVQTNIKYTYTSTTQSNMVAYTMSEMPVYEEIKPLNEDEEFWLRVLPNISKKELRFYCL